MEFGWPLGCLVYLVLSVFFVSALPDSFFVGDLSGINQRTYMDPGLQSTFNQSAASETGLISGVDFMKKLGSFLFATWTVPGLPGLLAALLFIVNVTCIAVPIVWVVDVVRGRP